MTYEVYELHRSWPQGDVDLLKAMLNSISLGGLVEFAKTPIELDMLDALPEAVPDLLDLPADDKAAAFAIAKFLDKVDTAIKQRGLWLSRNRRSSELRAG